MALPNSRDSLLFAESAEVLHAFSRPKDGVSSGLLPSGDPNRLLRHASFSAHKAADGADQADLLQPSCLLLTRCWRAARRARMRRYFGSFLKAVQLLEGMAWIRPDRVHPARQKTAVKQRRHRCESVASPVTFKLPPVRPAEWEVRSDAVSSGSAGCATSPSVPFVAFFVSLLGTVGSRASCRLQSKPAGRQIVSPVVCTTLLP